MSRNAPPKALGGALRDIQKTAAKETSVSFRQANFWLFVLFQKLTIPNSVSTVLSCPLKRSQMYVISFNINRIDNFFFCKVMLEATTTDARNELNQR